MYLAEEVLEQVEEDLSVSTLVLAVDDEGLLDFHIDFPGHLRGQVAWRVLVEPLLAQDIEDVRIVLVLEALRVEL